MKGDPVMKTRILSLLLVLVMLLPVCALADQPATAGDANLTGTVRFVCAYNAKQGMGDMIAAFNELYPNVTVEMTTISNNTEGNLRIDTSLLAGGEIDVLLSYTSTLTRERTDAGFFMDLTDMINADGIDMVDEWGGVIAVNDRIYNIPVDGLNYYVAINTTLWEKAGLGEVPTSWTMDEYADACRVLTADGVFGGTDSHGSDHWINHVYQAYGSNMRYTEDGKSVTYVSNPAFVETLERQVALEQEGVWYPWNEMKATGMQTQNVFLGGETATTITNNVTRFIADQDNYPIDFKVTFAPYPKLTAEDEHNYMEGPSKYGHLAITSTCQNVEAAWAFVKFFAREGNVYLVKAGHLPTWRYTDRDKAVTLLFGSDEAAEKLVDVEAYKRVVLNLDGENYYDTIVNTEIDNFLNSAVKEVLNYELEPAEAMAEVEEFAKDVLN